MVKNLPAMQETHVQSLGQEYPLEKEIATQSILEGSKITADGNCSREIKRHLLLGRKAILDSVLKSREITLLTKVHIVKAVVFSSSHVWM